MQMDGDESSNIEDRRGEGGFGGGAFGGGGFGGGGGSGGAGRPAQQPARVPDGGAPAEENFGDEEPF